MKHYQQHNIRYQKLHAASLLTRQRLPFDNRVRLMFVATSLQATIFTTGPRLSRRSRVRQMCTWNLTVNGGLTVFLFATV